MNAIFDQITENINIKHSKQPSPYVMQKVHYHDCYEIIFFLSGDVTYFIKDKIYQIKKHDLIFIAPFDLHRVLRTGEKYYDRIVINLRKEIFNTLYIKSDILNFFSSTINKISVTDNDIKNIFISLSKEININDEYSKRRIELLIEELLIMLNREIKNSNMQFVTNNINKRILSIISYINDNYMDNITLSFLAEKFYISTYYLAHLFKNVTGFTIIEYLNKKRISVAQQLLSTGKYSISSVSEMVGYNNLTSFSRTFKAICGISPMQYKKQYRNK